MTNYPSDIDPESGCRLPLPKRDELDAENDTTTEVGWKNIYKVDKWTLTSDLSESNATARQNTLEMYTGGFQPVYTNFTSNPYTGVTLSNPSVNLTNPATVQLGDAGGWGDDFAGVSIAGGALPS